jgi:hypothetical protein
MNLIAKIYKFILNAGAIAPATQKSINEKV